MDRICSVAMTILPCISEKKADIVKRLVGLLACILAIALFVCICLALEQTPAIKPIAQFIDERDINANMYFYTEVEEFSEANINMNNTMAYPPRSH
ncbi:MAG: hypothetical protein L6247_06185 [Desulfobacteraceae bacterium]|nr:hypothetical protein [Pseudomonadota bacterium]MCG2755133.1 hypothetical protein [Desulfobacteraceae bacterium]